ncbi:MAG: S8 family peptidase [Adhaeribacter sp.]
MKLNITPFTAKSVVAAGILSVLVMAGCNSNLEEPVALSGNSSSADVAAQALEHMPNELLVKLKAGQSEEAKARVLAKIGGKVSEKILTKTMEHLGDKEGILVVRTPLAVFEAINKMKGGAEIEFAEPNYIYYHTATATDTYFSNNSLWGMYGAGTTPANQYGSNAAAAWAAGTTGSKGVYVGIIDEGVQYNHPELDGQFWTNPYDAVDGKDNDGNGYIDDVRGWDFDGNDNSIYDGGTKGTLDDHGTHVAGTIGGEANGTGVAGVNWNVTLISGKFIGRKGGTTASAVKAIDYFTNLKLKHGLNIVATNNSWGGGGYSQALYDAISRANNAGIMFIAAAGNNGTNNDVTVNYPSNYDLPNVIAVAAIDKNGLLGSFSQYGAKTVDLGAPGVGIISTTAYNTYSAYDGTSMATPHVTGAVALYASTHPGATVAQIRNAILSSVVATPSLSGKTVTGGRLDVNAALSK